MAREDMTREQVRRIFLAHGPLSLGRVLRIYHARYDATTTADEIARAIRWLRRRKDLVVAHAEVSQHGQRCVRWCLPEWGALPQAEDWTAGAALVVLLGACYWLGGAL